MALNALFKGEIGGSKMVYWGFSVSQVAMWE